MDTAITLMEKPRLFAIVVAKTQNQRNQKFKQAVE
jgi:hypothetical protein